MKKPPVIPGTMHIIYKLAGEVNGGTHVQQFEVDIQLVDEAAKLLGIKSRGEAVHAVLREIVALHRFKKLMKKYAGRLEFEGYGQ
jgi:Arc/MetJ family transcription regulator